MREGILGNASSNHSFNEQDQVGAAWQSTAVWPGVLMLHNPSFHFIVRLIVFLIPHDS